MIIVASLSFMIFQFIGDPVIGMLREGATVKERNELRERLDLDKPVLIQFKRFLENTLGGDFGISYRNQRPVLELMAERLPATIELALVAGIPLGVFSALKPDGFFARIIQTTSLVGISVPTFVTGIMLILVFSVWLNWLPSFGRGDTIDLGWWSTGFLTISGMKALILPAITLALYQLTLIMRLVRSEMLDVLSTEYIRYARARGLPRRWINFHLALKNALMPVITITGMQIVSIIAFSVVTETVFHWPGIGLLFIQAVGFVDVPVLAAYLMFIGLVFVTINTIVDIIYSLVDPRLRDSGSTGGQSS
jgi:peptide/nickel transport system permease protein